MSSSEDLYIKKIESAIRKIRLGTAQPSELNVAPLFNQLKSMNLGMHDELMNNYKSALQIRNTKQKTTGSLYR